MNKEETKQLFESIMAEVAVIVKRKIEEHFGSPVGSESPETSSDDELDESYVSPLEKENERFVEQVCKEYNLQYFEGDSVCAEKSDYDTLEKVRGIIAGRMPVGRISTAYPDNVLYFTFKSWKTNRL